MTATGAVQWDGQLKARRVSSGWSVAAFIFLSNLAVLVAAPSLSRLVPFLFLAMATVSAVLLARSSAQSFVEFALWVWALSAGLRRVVDWRTGFHPDSLVLVAPLVVTVCAVFGLQTFGFRTDRRLGRLLLRLLVLVLYAAVVAAVLRRGPVALGLAALQILSPLILAVFMLAKVPEGGITQVLDRFTVWVLAIVGGYGVVQYFLAPAWDRQWLIDVDDVASSFGRPERLEIRVFSTVNDPGSLGVLLVFCVLWVLMSRHISSWAVVALVVGGSCLALTLVRSAWIALLVALFLTVLRGWLKPERLLVMVVGLAFVGTLFGTAMQPVVDRWQQSQSAGTQDESFQERLSFQSSQLMPALTNVTGEGLGASGTAARRDDATNQRFADTDSGYLETLRTFGGPLGLSLLVATVAASFFIFLRPHQAARGAAAFAAVIPVFLIFSSVYSNIMAVVVWLGMASGVANNRDWRFLSARTD